MKLLTKEFASMAAERAIKTFAQTLLGGITVGATFEMISWLYILSVAGVATLASLLTSIISVTDTVGVTKETKTVESHIEPLSGSTPLPNRVPLGKHSKVE